jgi:hypothetical protein
VPFEDFTRLARHGPVTRKIWWQEHGVRAKALRSDSRHCRSHSEPARFIGGSADDGAASAPCDHDGLSPQLRIVPLLHGRVERVHIDVHDFAYRHAGTILFISTEQMRACLSPAREGVNRETVTAIFGSFTLSGLFGGFLQSVDSRFQNLELLEDPFKRERVCREHFLHLDIVLAQYFRELLVWDDVQSSRGVAVS